MLKMIVKKAINNIDRT